MEDLQRLRGMQQHIRALEQEYNDIKHGQLSGREYTHDIVTSSRKSKAPLFDSVDKYLDLLDETKKELIKIRTEYTALINKMPNAEYSALLRRRYLNGESWERIADEMGYSKDHARGYMHNKACEMLTHTKHTFYDNV